VGGVHRRVPVELVIFDCDGVLVDSERISNRVLAGLLTELGLPTTPRESMDTYMGSTMAGCITLIEERLGRPVPDGFPEHYLRSRMQALERDLVPIPRVESALDEIRVRGLATCVASSNSREVIRDALDWAGLLARFDGRLYSATDDVARGKPHPDVFLFAAEREGVRPERCVVVEDSPRGAAGGVAAGMRTLGFARDVSASELRAVGAEPFSDMSELAARLQRRGDRASSDGGVLG
jgi:HAD superfamily hydrolase (TIGR01509 family)